MTAPAPVAVPYRNRFWFRAPLLLLVPAVLVVAFLAVRHALSRQAEIPGESHGSLQTNWQSAIDIATSASTGSRRTVFPYSVVPGGVRDAKELGSAAATDPVVAAHYAGFHIARAHTLRLERPSMMYVSYRLNNRVYWTRNRIAIPAGETLISDGENYARVRCGNRLSPIAALPVSLSEPPTEKLETPAFIPPLLADLAPREGFSVDPLIAKIPGLGPVPFSGPVASGVPPAGGPPAGGPPVTLPPGGFPPILPPGVTPPGIETPPVSTPEPGALSLLLAGALLSGVLWALFRK